MRRAILPLGVFAATFAIASSARADMPGTYGFGSREVAMGGAVGADVSDFSASYYNPAGLALEEGVRLSFGYFYADNNFTIDGKDVGVKSSHGTLFGIAAGGKLFDVPFAIGIATHIPDEGLSRITALRQDVPRWELYDSRSTVLYLTASVAVQPFEWLEVGAGLSFLAATHGRFAISGKADLFSPNDSQLRHEVDADLTTVRYPTIGALFHLSEAATLGITYRGQTSLDLQLDGDLDAIVSVPGFDVPAHYELAARTVQAFLPQQLVLAASWKLIPSLHTNLDLTWVNWSAYENPTSRTSARLTAVLPPKFPVDLPDDLKATAILDPRFHDRLVPRLGVEWFVPGFEEEDGEPFLEVPIRVGYTYELTPLPKQNGETNFVDSDRHTLAAGAGIGIPAIFLKLDVHASVSLLPERIHLKSDPTNLVGDYRAEGQMANVGATVSGVFK